MLGTKIQRFVGTVSEEEQPYSKVRQMAISAQRRRNAQGNFVVDSSAVQMGFRLKSLNLLLSFRWESLWDTHLVAASFPANDSSVVLLRNQMLRELRNLHGLCSDVIEECQMGGSRSMRSKQDCGERSSSPYIGWSLMRRVSSSRGVTLNQIRQMETTLTRMVGRRRREVWIYVTLCAEGFQALWGRSNPKLMRREGYSEE